MRNNDIKSLLIRYSSSNLGGDVLVYSSFSPRVHVLLACRNMGIVKILERILLKLNTHFYRMSEENSGWEKSSGGYVQHGWKQQNIHGGEGRMKTKFKR